MTRDADGIPDNLSPLNCLSTSWVDESGIHIAYFDRAKLPQRQLTQFDLMEALDDADYVVTMGGASSILLAEGLLDCIGALLRAGHPLNFNLAAPAPFPPDSRERIYNRMHGDGGGDGLPGDRPLSTESVFAQIDDILKSVREAGSDDTVHG
jgi:hypothetical protein